MELTHQVQFQYWVLVSLISLVILLFLGILRITFKN